MRRDKRRKLCRRQIIASENTPSGYQYRIRGPLGVTNRRHFDGTLVIFYLENHRATRVVAEEVPKMLLPRLHRSATRRRLRGYLEVTNHEHFDVLCWANASRFAEKPVSSLKRPPNSRVRDYAVQ